MSTQDPKKRLNRKQAIWMADELLAAAPRFSDTKLGRVAAALEGNPIKFESSGSSLLRQQQDLEPGPWTRSKGKTAG